MGRPDSFSPNDVQLSERIIYFGEVVDITDPYETRQIKVRIPDFDKRVENADLPPCYPLTSPFLHFVPKVGERVAVVLDRIYNADKTTNQEKRYYLAITISQIENLDFDPFYYTATSNESDGWVERGTPISEIPTAKGTYLTKDQIGLQGRKNTDLIFKDSEVLIRAGKHEKDKPTSFNRKDPVFIQMRYGIENASNQKTFKTITKVENIPATHNINITSDSQNRLMIKVIRLSDNFIEENFNQGYASREELISATKRKIKDFQRTYVKWNLNTSEQELASEPTIFPNNQKIVKQQVEDKKANEYDQFAGSVMNLVAEKLNLLSHKSAKNYNLTDPEKQIDDATQLEINSTAHPMVYGDNLVDFLNLLKNVIANHVHPYHGLPTSQDDMVKKLLNFNMESLLDLNIRIG
jgi:hypothetical protein